MTSSPSTQRGVPVDGPCGRRLGPFDAHHVGLALLFVLEALVFYSQLASRVTPFHPPSFDQVVYMVETYHLIDAFQAHGWSALVERVTRPTSPTGVSFAVQGTLLALVGGPNRTAMLSLNLISFLVLQLAVFTTVRRRLQSAVLAWIAVALLLSLKTSFNYAGGIFDFRIDFSALCVYGIWICFVLRSDGFRDLRVSLLVAAAGVWLVLMRFITIAYLGGVFGGLVVALLLARRRARSREERADYAGRARNVLLAGSLTGLCVFPFLFAARTLLWRYYGVGHLFGEEKDIRAAEVGIGSSLEHVLYYPLNLLRFQLGELGAWLIGAVVVLSVGAGLLGRTSPWEWLRRIRQRRFDLLVCALATAVPLTILALDQAKSPVVAGIVLVPLIVWILTLCASLWPGGWVETGQGEPARPALRAARLVCAAALVAGLAGFLAKASADRGLSRPDLERIVRLNETIVRHLDESGLDRPRFSFDRVCEFLNVGTLELYGYERLGRFLHVRGYMGHGPFGIFATPRETALQLVHDSDVVVLTDPDLDRAAPYPINTKVKEYWAELWQATNEDFELLTTVEIAGVPHRVFVRPRAKGSGQEHVPPAH